MKQKRATFIGFIAVLLWSLLATFTVATNPVPPFLLTAICFAIGGFIGIIWTAKTTGFKVLSTIPLKTYAFGTLGLFGYHFLYFSALRSAPAAQAGLIAYLWPLFIVLFSGLLPNERLRFGHILGALISFMGAALIVLGNADSFQSEYFIGYALAAGCALTWSGYSVLTRRLGDVPTQAVSIHCLASAVLSLVAHLAFEQTVWPATYWGWGAIFALGVGPLGLAFYVWDIGVKRGDIQLLGVASYAAPLLSTGVLIIVGFADPSWSLILAAGLITGGAFVAAKASATTGG